MIEYDAQTQTVIAAAIALDYERYEPLLATLKPEMLVNSCHSMALERARELRSQGKPVDIVSLTEQGTKEDMEIFSELSMCATSVVSFSSLESVVTRTVSWWLRKWLKREAYEALKDDSPEPAQALQSVLSRFIDMRNANGQEDINIYETYLSGLSESVEARRIKTGIRRLDETLGGLPLGSLSVIGARPSVGKTTLAINMAVRNLKAGKNVLMFSLEMSREQVLDRIASMMSGVQYTHINAHHLTQDERKTVEGGMRVMDGYDGKLTIVDNVYAPDSMVSEISKTTPQLVIVDFLQYVALPHAETRAAEVSDAVRQFKQAARIYNCHLMLLSQLSRNADRNTRPTMADLKESGGIEEGGDLVMLLHRPGILDSSVALSVSELIVAKNKYGRIGKVNLSFDGQTQRFTDG